jgi:hypothetical protein
MTLGFSTLGGGDDAFDTGLGHDPQLVLGQAQAAGAHGHLLLGFFAGDVQRWHARGHADTGFAAGWWTCRCPDRRRSAPPSRPPGRHRVPGPARRTLWKSAGISSMLTSARVLSWACCPVQPERPLGGCGATAFNHGFDQGIPDPALAALARPLGKGCAALCAAVNALGLCHLNLHRKTAMIAHSASISAPPACGFHRWPAVRHCCPAGLRHSGRRPGP